ncbi:MAG: chitobiase/beta-hexosaminidase C-terminal domain-containing protein [Holophagales bacterium]|nr:chitobiase/beta-hexosaminidase C-terminal domain-containing protein [Holophagales bacterium]
MRLHAALLATFLVTAGGAWRASGAAGAAGAEVPPAPELHVVATAHLDTQWRWTVRDTIDDFLPETMRGNFALFEKYPDYVFTFEGAFHYALMKEYYPAEWERLKAYVKAGRWKVAGSWVDAADTHVPSPESLVRQTLYGNGFFRRELGVTSRDVFLPDCFGFSFALPSVAAHCGLTAFSTQKLTWGAAMKIPFDVGLWEGVDGSSLLASINPGDYAAELKGNLTLDPDFYAAIDRQAALSGQPVAMKYFGTGDVGVPPLEPSVDWLQKSVHGPGPLKVRSVAPDQLAKDLAARLSPAERARLPHYRGELLLTSHGAGCYTSQAAMKSFNRTNQSLAFAAEAAAVAADGLGGAAYPREALGEAWVRFLWHQFHDDLTGTSIPEAYTFSWNDETISAGAFADVLGSSVGAVSRALDTRGAGVPLVVFNPLALEREDAVEALVRFPGEAPRAVRVTGPDGRDVPAQVVSRDGPSATVVFVARVAPTSFSAFTVAPSSARPTTGETKVTASSLENTRLSVRLDAVGNVASVFDKLLGRELLSGPLALQLFEDEPRKWSAWEVEYAALSAPPREVVAGPAKVRVVEEGPARVALEVVRTAAGSTFTQTLRLAAGAAGDRLEIVTDVDWRTKATLLKAAFPLAAASRTATYDLGLGVVERGTNRPNAYEVPAQQWAGVADASGVFGVAVLNDSRHGWDRPDEKTLRLSLVHTPRVVKSWDWLADQASNDLGRHRVVTAVTGHAGDFRAGRVAHSAERLNQPLLAWQAQAHEGALGKEYAFLRLEGMHGKPPVSVRALKVAEESDEVVVRLQELSGLPLDGVRLRFARPVVAVREVNGAEEPADVAGTGGFLPGAPAAPPALKGGAVELAFAPFRPRTLAVRLAPEAARLEPPVAVPLVLPWDLDGISRDEARKDGDFDGQGRSLAGELLPATVVSGGIPFRTGPQGPGEKNVLVARGQKLALPAGDFDRVYLVAAAIGGDRRAPFGVDGKAAALTVPDWAEPVGQWNNRMVGGARVDEADGIAPAYAKETPLAWVATHRHGARGENEAYALAHLFRLRLDVPKGARELTLPSDERLRILAVTAARNPNDAVLSAQRFLDPGAATVVHFETPGATFVERTSVVLTSPTPGATIRFTLDGSVPSPDAPVYTGPIPLERTATVRARAFAPGRDDRFVASSTFTRVVPRDAAKVDASSLAPGLSCRLYEGEWRKLPDFAALTPARALVIPTVALTPEMPKERFGLVCAGYLAVPADGLTTFSLRAEDGAQLLVDGESVIGNEPTDYLSRRGAAALQAGLHAVEVRYFQRNFVAGLGLRMDAPGESLTPVPPSRLFHAR